MVELLRCFFRFLFLSDLVITFFTPYYDDDEQIVVSLKKIAKNYLKFWFWMDLISVLPLDYVLSNGEFSVLLRISRLPRLYKIVKITKVFRTVKSVRSQNNFWSKLYDLLRLNPGIDRLALNLFSIFLVCHIFACLWHFFAEISVGTSSWIWRLELEDTSNIERYVASLYWIIQTVITVGYGDVGAENTMERIIAILAMFSGVIFFSLTIGSLTSLISDMDAKTTAYESKLNVLMEIKSKYDIKDEMFSKVQRALKYGIYRTDETAVEFLASLPYGLKVEASVVIFKGLTKGIRLFEDATKEFVAEVCPHLKEVKFNQHEIVYSEKDYATEIFFLKRGRVALMLPEKDKTVPDLPFFTILEGSCFGDVDIFFSEKRKFMVRAEDDVEVLTLEKMLFQKIIMGKFRRVGYKMRKHAQEKMLKQLNSFEKGMKHLKKLDEQRKRRRRKSFLAPESQNFDAEFEPFIQLVN